MEKSEVQAIAVGQVWKESKERHTGLAIVKYVGAKHICYYFDIERDVIFDRKIAIDSPSSELMVTKEEFLGRYVDTKFRYEL